MLQPNSLLPLLPDANNVLLVLFVLAASPFAIRAVARQFGLSGWLAGSLAVALACAAILLVRAFGMSLPSFGTIVLALSALLVLPYLVRAGGGVITLPFRAVAAFGRAIVSLFTAVPSAHLIDRISEHSVSRFLRRATKDSHDPLLTGDRRAAAEARWNSSNHPWLFQTIPEDVRRSVVWDGRVVGGYSVTWLAWRHCTPGVIAAVSRTAGKIGLRAGVIVFLLSLAGVAVWVLTHEYQAPTPYPTWSEGYSILPRIEWYLLVVIDAACRVGSAALFLAIGSALLGAAAIYWAFWRNLHAWWSQATAALAAPTRDSLVIYKHRADARAAEQAAYTRQVELALRGQERGLPLLARTNETAFLYA